MALPLSVIDFATVRKDQSLGESFADSVTCLLYTSDAADDQSTV